MVSSTETHLHQRTPANGLFYRNTSAPAHSSQWALLQKHICTSALQPMGSSRETHLHQRTPSLVSSTETHLHQRTPPTGLFYRNDICTSALQPMGSSTETLHQRTTANGLCLQKHLHQRLFQYNTLCLRNTSAPAHSSSFRAFPRIQAFFRGRGAPTGRLDVSTSKLVVATSSVFFSTVRLLTSIYVQCLFQYVRLLTSIYVPCLFQYVRLLTSASPANGSFSVRTPVHQRTLRQLFQYVRLLTSAPAHSSIYAQCLFQYVRLCTSIYVPWALFQYTHLHQHLRPVSFSVCTPVNQHLRPVVFFSMYAC